MGFRNFVLVLLIFVMVLGCAGCANREYWDGVKSSPGKRIQTFFHWLGDLFVGEEEEDDPCSKCDYVLEEF